MSKISDHLESISLESKNLANLSKLVFNHLEFVDEASRPDAMDMAWYLSALMGEHNNRLEGLLNTVMKASAHKEVLR